MAARGTAERRKDKRMVVENVRRVLLKEYLLRETQRAGFGGLDIQRTPMGTRVTLIAERPGLGLRRLGGGAKGCLVVIAGKLTGHRHRRVKFKLGNIKYCGEPRNTWMWKGFAIARVKPGGIGW